MQEETVVVKYKTQKQYCSCCDQKLPNPKMSKEIEFEFSKEGAMSWADWHSAIEYPDDIDGMVYEYVRETISFYATSSYEKLFIEDSEIERVKEFIMRVFIV